MRTLVVLDHPERRSFNGVIADTAATAPVESGHQVEVSDLYRMRFTSTADPDDFHSEREDADSFRLDREQLRRG